MAHDVSTSTYRVTLYSPIACDPSAFRLQVGRQSETSDSNVRVDASWGPYVKHMSGKIPLLIPIRDSPPKRTIVSANLRCAASQR